MDFEFSYESKIKKKKKRNIKRIFSQLERKKKIPLIELSPNSQEECS